VAQTADLTISNENKPVEDLCPHHHSPNHSWATLLIIATIHQADPLEKSPATGSGSLFIASIPPFCLLTHLQHPDLSLLVVVCIPLLIRGQDIVGL